jgi:formylglycine-generating enzyme required for sulfatase activity
MPVLPLVRVRRKATDEKGWGRDVQPVIKVSWKDAKEYIAWLSRTSGKPYRLLTEAEWEYSARARSSTTYSWGDEIGKSNANCSGCDSRWDRKQPAPVGSFKPNAFGLHDMHGNVWEWVEDCYSVNYRGSPNDGLARTDGDCNRRVVRGGAWDSSPLDLRSAERVGFNPIIRGFDVGFRVARTLHP